MLRNTWTRSQTSSYGSINWLSFSANDCPNKSKRLACDMIDLSIQLVVPQKKKKKSVQLVPQHSKHLKNKNKKNFLLNSLLRATIKDIDNAN